MRITLHVKLSTLTRHPLFPLEAVDSPNRPSSHWAFIRTRQYLGDWAHRAVMVGEPCSPFFDREQRVLISIRYPKDIHDLTFSQAWSIVPHMRPPPSATTGDENQPCDSSHSMLLFQLIFLLRSSPELPRPASGLLTC